MSNGEETAARGMIQRQLAECVATALAVGQARFARTTQNKCVAEAARVAVPVAGSAVVRSSAQRAGRSSYFPVANPQVCVRPPLPATATGREPQRILKAYWRS
jgi:hypothetical protein